MINNQTFRNCLAAGIVCQGLCPMTSDSITVDHRCSYNGTIAPALPNINPAYPYIRMSANANGRFYIYYYNKLPSFVISCTKIYNGVELPTFYTSYTNSDNLYVLVDDNGIHRFYYISTRNDAQFAYDKTNGVFMNNYDSTYSVSVPSCYTVATSGTSWTHSSVNISVKYGETFPISANVIWASRDIIDTDGNVYMPTSKPISGSYDRVYVIYTYPFNYIQFVSDGEYSWGNFRVYCYNSANGTFITSVTSSTIWSNFDIITEDGDVWLAASDPIPVYE